MRFQCPHCGQPIAVVKRIGRAPLDMPVTRVCDALRAHRSVQAAANELGCSRAYVYKLLKAAGLKAQDVTRDRVNQS